MSAQHADGEWVAAVEGREVERMARKVVGTLIEWHELDVRKIAPLFGMSSATLYGKLRGAKTSGAFAHSQVVLIARLFGVPVSWFDDGIVGPIPPLPPTSALCAVRDLNPEPAVSGPARLHVMAGGRRADAMPQAVQHPLLSLIPNLEREVA